MTFFWKLLLASISLICVTAVAVGSFVQLDIRSVLVPLALQSLSKDVRALSTWAGSYVSSSHSDVLALRSATEVDGIVRSRSAGGMDPETGLTEEQLRRSLERFFISFLDAKPQYSQVRLIGIADGGREIVRIDRALNGGPIRVVAETGLQPKQDRPYFAETLKLEAGAIYMSPIDLNREFGEIEKPHVPVSRISTPVFGADGKPFGFLIVNIDMRTLFTKLRSSVTAPTALYMVNPDGDYLIHPDPARTFGFDLGTRHRIFDRFPGLGTLLERRDDGGFRIADSSGTRFSVAIAPVNAGSVPLAYLAESVPEPAFLSIVSEQSYSILKIAIAASLFAIMLAFLTARSISRPLQKTVAAVNAFSRDEPAALPQAKSGEFAILNGALRNLMEQESLSREIWKSASDAIITIDLDRIVTSWNPAAERMFGYDEEEMIGRSVDAIVPGSDKQEMLDIRSSIMSGGKPKRHVTVRTTRSGQNIDVSITSSPIRDVSGTIIGISGIIRDITEQRRLEEMVRIAFEGIPVGIIMSDEKGRFSLFNSAVATMFGYDADEFSKLSVEDLVPGDLRMTHMDDRAMFQANPEKRSMGVGRDLQALRKDGTTFPVEIGLSPIVNAKTVNTIASIVDISDRQKAEAAATRHTEELERSNAELAQFAYIASHDLQEPLRMVASFCDLLQQGYSDKLDKDGREFVAFAVDGAHRMQQLINDLLAYSRLNANPPEPVRVSISDLVDVIRRDYEMEIRDTGATVEYDTLPDVLCGEMQARQLFQNLISNGLKFHRDEPPHIRITAQRDGEFIRFSVADNGIGIAPEKRETAFLIFQRLNSRDKYPGTGIGLAICRKIVEQHGGKIAIKAKDGPGTTFTFTLPAADGI